MNYLVSVRVNKSDQFRYIVPVIADNDFDAGLKAHELLKQWNREGYKIIDIDIVNNTVSVEGEGDKVPC